MYRQIIAATAISLMATGAMAQTERAGTTPGSTIDANQDSEVDRVRADYEARIVDLDARIKRLEDAQAAGGAGVADSGVIEQVQDDNTEDRTTPAASN